MRQKLIFIISAIMLILGSFAFNTNAVDYSVIHLEAEDGVYSAPYKVINDSEASGGKALLADTSGMQKSVTKDQMVEITVEFEVPERGVYFIWHRGRATGTGCSLFANVDSATREFLEYKINDGDNYDWVCADWYPLEAGKHTINVLHRVGGVYVDCFEITQDPNYTPLGGERFPLEYNSPSNGSSESIYYNLPAYIPPAEHPRVEFRASDLPRIRENLTHPQNAQTYQELLRFADIDIGDAWTDILTYNAKDNTNYTYGAVIEANAFLYQLNGDRQRGLNAIRWARNYISSTGLRSLNNQTQQERGGMYVVYIAAKVYDWCYDLLTEDDKRYIQGFMLCRMTPVEGWPPQELTYHVNSKAMETWLLRESLAAAIAIYDERQDVYNYIAGRILDRIVPVKNYIDRNIFQEEGTSYGSFRLQFQLESALLFKAMGYENIWDAAVQQYAPYGNFYIRLPSWKFFSYGDDAYESEWGFKPKFDSLAFLAGNMYKDPYMKNYYYMSRERGTSSGMGSDAITPVRHLIINDVNVGVASMSDLPLSMYANDPGGRMAARTSWEMGPGSSAVAVLMNIKQLNLESHSHNDSGSFDIYYKGYLALDSGLYQGVNNTYTSEHNRNYGSQTIAHNTMLIEDPDEPLRKYQSVQDGGQRGNANTSIFNAKEYEDLFTENVIFGDVLSHNFGPDPIEPAYTYMKGDMTEAYTDKVANFQRTFMFLNFFDETYPAALIVFDDLTTSNKEFKKKWLIHSQEEPELDDKNKSFTIKRAEFCYDGRLINQALLPEKLTFTKIGGEGHQFEVKGINFDATPKSIMTTDSGMWRVEISPAEKAEQDYFLNVIQVGDNDDSIVPLKAEIVENNDEFIGVSIKDRVVYLKKNGKKRAYEMKVSDKKSDDEAMYIITSLAEGTWRVYDANGDVIYTQDVTEDHDSLSFTGKRGSYMLKWSYNANVKHVDLTLPALLPFTPKTDIDVQVGNFFETFEKPFREIDGVLYAPVEATLKKLEIEYTQENGVFNAKKQSFSIENEGAMMIEDTLYLKAESFIGALGTTISYDEIGKVARIPYSERAIDFIFIKKYDDPEIINIKRATGCENTNGAAYLAVDGGTSTHWSAVGRNEWIMFELYEEEYISGISLWWMNGHTRQMDFDVLLSQDGENWDTAFSGYSAKLAEKGWEDVPIKQFDKKYKYVKLACRGNTSTENNTLEEIKIYRQK